MLIPRFSILALPFGIHTPNMLFFAASNMAKSSTRTPAAPCNGVSDVR